MTEEKSKFLFSIIVPVYNTELLYRMSRSSVLPAGSYGLVGVPDAVFDNVTAVLYKKKVGSAHSEKVLSRKIRLLLKHKHIVDNSDCCLKVLFLDTDNDIKL